MTEFWQGQGETQEYNPYSQLYNPGYTAQLHELLNEDFLEGEGQLDDGTQGFDMDPQEWGEGSDADYTPSLKSFNYPGYGYGDYGSGSGFDYPGYGSGSDYGYGTGSQMYGYGSGSGGQMYGGYGTGSQGYRGYGSGMQGYRGYGSGMQGYGTNPYSYGYGDFDLENAMYGSGMSGYPSNANYGMGMGMYNPSDDVNGGWQSTRLGNPEWEPQEENSEYYPRLSTDTLEAIASLIDQQ